jgi:hypothetical protein
MKTSTTLLAILLSVCLFGCDRNSSPEGRSKLRDNELSEKIEQLNKKQLVILDSLQILDQKIEVLKKANTK